ncbi:hypothetical protein C4B38_000277, partial [Diabrotica virgifera virgifera]
MSLAAMLSRRALRLKFSTLLKTATYSTAPASTATNRDNFYQNIAGAQNDDTNPEGWENAKPFDSIPGPKPLPVLGNMWRFFPGAEFHLLIILLTIVLYILCLLLFDIDWSQRMLLRRVIAFLPWLFLSSIVRSTLPSCVMVIPRYLYASQCLIISPFPSVRFQQRYGDVVRLGGIWGRRDKIFLYDTGDMEDMLRNTGPFPSRFIMDAIFYYRRKLRKDVYKGNLGLALLQGEEWYKLRKIVNPILMQPKTIQQYTTRMDGVAKNLMKLISHRMTSSGTNTTPDDFEKDLYKWALDSVAIIALNRQLGALNAHADAETTKFVLSVLRLFDQSFYLEQMPPYWKYLPSKRLKDYCDNLDFITDVLTRMIDKSLAEFKNEDGVPDEELGVLQRLIKLDKQTAVIMTMDMITAGVDTTGKTLGAVLYFLARNPDKQSILREEILKYLPEKDTVLTADNLNEMQYLKAAVKESSRIAPIAITSLRTASKNMIVRGYQVPKG